MKLKYDRLCCLVLASWYASVPAVAISAGTLKIEHAPVALAVRGQDVLFRTQVVPGTKPVKNVTLFYAVSRDAAPYKLPMQDSGSGWFTGSISANLTTGLNQLLYYIEARDTSDSTAETPWYTITVKDSGSVASATQPQKRERSWTKPALIAGGVVLAGGAALALASGGGGGGGSSAPNGTLTNAAGTYNGTVTLCVQPPGTSSTCSSHATTILIDRTGMVSSDTLYEGKHLEGKLAGDTFLLLASVTETNGTGEIQFLGTVINNHIAGSVQGTLTTSTGTGIYSGNFSAVK